MAVFVRWTWLARPAAAPLVHHHRRAANQLAHVEQAGGRLDGAVGQFVSLGADHVETGLQEDVVPVDVVGERVQHPPIVPHRIVPKALAGVQVVGHAVALGPRPRTERVPVPFVQEGLSFGRIQPHAAGIGVDQHVGRLAFQNVEAVVDVVAVQLLLVRGLIGIAGQPLLEELLVHHAGPFGLGELVPQRQVGVARVDVQAGRERSPGPARAVERDSLPARRQLRGVALRPQPPIGRQRLDRRGLEADHDPARLSPRGPPSDQIQPQFQHVAAAHQLLARHLRVREPAPVVLAEHAQAALFGAEPDVRDVVADDRVPCRPRRVPDAHYAAVTLRVTKVCSVAVTLRVTKLGCHGGVGRPARTGAGREPRAQQPGRVGPPRS